MLYTYRAPIRKLIGSFFPLYLAGDPPIQWVFWDISLINLKNLLSKSWNVFNFAQAYQKAHWNVAFSLIRKKKMQGDFRFYAGFAVGRARFAKEIFVMILNWGVRRVAKINFIGDL